MKLKHLLVKTLAGCGMFLLPLTASAQTQARPPITDRNQAQDDREARDNDRLFDRLRGDLDRAQAATLPYSTDRSRVTTARDRLDACARLVNDGDYDRRLFTDTITAIQRVVELNRLSDQTRNYLIGDLNQLQSLQARLES